MNYILSNQDTVLAQITQLESSITQTEVIHSLGRQDVGVTSLKSFYRENVSFYMSSLQRDDGC